ncbi:MAG: InlB B-repeat-containing protein [Clostridia bacterium]|nr:InlB B-repeat-containing protein [Clostridia bacterium]
MKKWIYITISAVLILSVIATFFLIGKKKYEVVFDANGGNQIPTQIIVKGEKAKIPVDPEKEGWDFKEWLLNGKTYNFNEDVTGNIKLVAKWESKTQEVETYFIKFDTDGGNEIEELKVEEGNPISKPEDPIKEKHIFEYWTLDDKEFDFNVKVLEDMTLIAKWKEIPKYTVTFNSNGGTAITKQIITEDSTAIKPKDPTRNNYTFVNWLLNGKPYDFNSKVTSELTLTANWKEISKYTVTFNSNGGTAITKQIITEDSTAIKPKDPTRNGYTFINWTLNNKEYDFKSKITSNISLVANWKLIIQKPGVPSFTLSGVGGSPISGAYIIKINGVEGAEGYEIYKTINSGQFAMFKRIEASVAGGDVEQIDGVYSGETNSYKVRAYKKDGNNYVYGDFSSVKSESIEPLPTPTLKITGFGGGPEGFSILLEMTTANPGIEKFEIYRSTSRESGYIKIGEAYGVNSLAEESVELPGDEEYFFKVRGYEKDGIRTIYTGYSNIIKSSDV